MAELLSSGLTFTLATITKSGGESRMPILNGKSELGWIPRGYQKITIASGNVGLISNPHKHVVLAIIRPEGADIRWRDDGNNPTATDGIKVAQDTTIEYLGEIADLRFTPISGTATVHVALYE